MDQTFGKSYKLCNKKLIDSIFATGATQKQYPFVARYQTMSLPTENSFQMVISAPKRTFRSAVERNRIKRICREAVRKNKQILEPWLTAHKQQVGIFLIYSGKEEMTHEKLELKTNQLFQKIIDDLHAKTV